MRGARRMIVHARRTPAMHRARWTNARHTRGTRGAHAWHVLRFRRWMLVTTSSGQTSAVWDQHQTLKSAMLQSWRNALKHGPGWVALCFCPCRLDLSLHDRDDSNRSRSRLHRISHFLYRLASWITLVWIASSLLRYDGKQDKPSLLIGTVSWPLPVAGCALSALCMRASCAHHARAIRSAR